jgi:hypothetical protein
VLNLDVVRAAAFFLMMLLAANLANLAFAVFSCFRAASLFLAVIWALTALMVVLTSANLALLAMDFLIVCNALFLVDL